MDNSSPSLSDDDLDPKPEIQQDVTGDHNQLIGQVLGGVVVNNLTIYERVPQTSAPSTISGAQSLTQQEYRQRKVLLNKVREFWVKGVLKASLHARILIELGLQERLDLVQRPFGGVDEFPDAPGETIEQSTDATVFFEQLGAGRTLLILGEPGSGKTITLLKLAEDLISSTELDLSQPIPVVFNLSSWAYKPQIIEEWLIQELLEKYQVSKSLGNTWIKTESLILLLDGLDEVKAEQRNACIQALNKFMQTHGTIEITICCRIRDYQVLTDRLRLRSAICLQPLTPEQINSYFDQAGEQLSALKMVLNQDSELQKLATSPLMMSIMSLAYSGFESENIVKGGSREKYIQRLFETYIERMFLRRNTAKQKYTKKNTKFFLSWLAKILSQDAQSTFLIERLQPTHLRDKRARKFYAFCFMIIFGLFFTPITFLISIEFTQALIKTLTINNNIYYFINFYTAEIWIILSGLIVVTRDQIKTFEMIKWSSRKAIDAFKNEFSLGWIDVIRFGGIPLFLGLYSGLSSGLNSDEIKETISPNQGIHETIKNLFIFLIFFNLPIIIFSILLINLLVVFSLKIQLFIWLPSRLTLPFYLFALGIFLFSISCFLMTGLPALIQYFSLRLVLYFQGSIPWNYARFLNFATERLFLQKVGGGYIFVHRMLLEHFAEMSLERGKR